MGAQQMGSSAENTDDFWRTGQTWIVFERKCLYKTSIFPSSLPLFEKTFIHYLGLGSMVFILKAETIQPSQKIYFVFVFHGFTTICLAGLSD